MCFLTFYFSLALFQLNMWNVHSVCERADDVSCLCELGAQRYANTCWQADGKAEHSTEYINTDFISINENNFQLIILKVYFQ